MKFELNDIIYVPKLIDYPRFYPGYHQIIRVSYMEAKEYGRMELIWLRINSREFKVLSAVIADLIQQNLIIPLSYNPA